MNERASEIRDPHQITKDLEAWKTKAKKKMKRKKGINSYALNKANNHSN